MAKATFKKLQRVAEGDDENAIKQTRWAFTEIAIDVEQEPDRADLSAWAASTAYSVGDRVVASTGFDERWFVATVAGTSAASEPSWSNDVGDTVVDGGVTWRTESPSQRKSWAQKWRRGNIDTAFATYMSMILENATLQDDTVITGTDSAPTVAWNDADVEFQAAAVINRIAELP